MKQVRNAMEISNDIYMTHKTRRFVAIVMKNLKYLCGNGDETFSHITVVDGQIMNWNVG